MSAFYLDRLQSEFQQRQRTNPRYSLRAFAKFLEIDSSTLTAVLKKKRPLPSAQAKRIAKKMQLSPADQLKFINSIQLSRAYSNPALIAALRAQTQVLEEENHFRIIAEWEYYAVLSLLKNKGFRSDREWIAKRLGLSVSRAETVWERLIATGLITPAGAGKFVRAKQRFTTSEDVISASLRKSHREMLEIGVQKLETVAVEDRDYSSETIAIDRQRLGEAKNLIREFREKLSLLFADGETDEVYHLGVQLYPLTQLKKGETPRKTAKPRGSSMPWR